MSLDWNIEHTESYKRYKSVTPVTEALIWTMMSIGMDRITQGNLKEVMIRCHIWERFAGFPLQRGGQGVSFTYDDFKDHIGLSTNISPLTRRQFLKDATKKVEAAALQTVNGMIRGGKAPKEETTEEEQT